MRWVRLLRSVRLGEVGEVVEVSTGSVGVLVLRKATEQSWTVNSTRVKEK